MIFLFCIHTASAKLTILTVQGTITDAQGFLVDGQISLNVIGGEEPDAVDRTESFAVDNGFFNAIFGARDEGLNLLCGENYELTISFRGEDLGSYSFTACKGDLYLHDILVVNEINVITEEDTAVIDFSTPGEEYFIEHCTEGCPQTGLNIKSAKDINLQTTNIDVSGSLVTNSLVVRGENLSQEIIPNKFCIFTGEEEVINRYGSECPDGWEKQIDAEGIIRGAIKVENNIPGKVDILNHRHELTPIDMRNADVDNAWDDYDIANVHRRQFTESPDTTLIPGGEYYPPYIKVLVCCRSRT